MEEILKIKVQLDDIFEVEGKNGSARMIAFSGEADGPYFSGKILPHGVDTQKSEAGKPLQLSARYMLEGIDCTGKQCCLFIENNGEEAGGQIVTKPRIYTDSESLSWMEGAALCGTVESCGEDQVMIRIRRMEKEKLCPYRVEIHSIAAGDNRIFASLYLPECAQTVPAVA